MKKYIIYSIVLVFPLITTIAFCEERVVIRDIEPTQFGVTKIKYYYDKNDLLVVREALKPKDIFRTKTNSCLLIVHSRNRYFYNKKKQKICEIIEIPNNTIFHVTITEYDGTDQIVAERSFDINGHNYFSRLYKNGKVVKVIKNPQKVVSPKERGIMRAKKDIGDGKMKIFHYGKPWSQGKPLVDSESGLPVEIVAGCCVRPEFVEETRAYNKTMRQEIKNRNKQIKNRKSATKVQRNLY